MFKFSFGANPCKKSRLIYSQVEVIQWHQKEISKLHIWPLPYTYNHETHILVLNFPTSKQNLFEKHLVILEILVVQMPRMSYCFTSTDWTKTFPSVILNTGKTLLCFERFWEYFANVLPVFNITEQFRFKLCGSAGDSFSILLT